jgi:predicted transcriptional regulator of viral defense system
VRVRRGLYAAVNPATGLLYAGRYEIASKLFADACVVYHSALEFYGVANQAFNTVYVASATRFREFEYDGVEYVRIVPQIEKGVVEQESHAVIRVTDLERTVVDCLDRIDLAGGIDELTQGLTASAYLREKELAMYLMEYDKNFLYQKAGYFLSRYKRGDFSADFFAMCKQKAGGRKSYLTENPSTSVKLNKDWLLIVPEALENGDIDD